MRRQRARCRAHRTHRRRPRTRWPPRRCGCASPGARRPRADPRRFAKLCERSRVCPTSRARSCSTRGPDRFDLHVKETGVGEHLGEQAGRGQREHPRPAWRRRLRWPSPSARRRESRRTGWSRQGPRPRARTSTGLEHRRHSRSAAAGSTVSITPQRHRITSTLAASMSIHSSCSCLNSTLSRPARPLAPPRPRASRRWHRWRSACRRAGSPAPP